MSRGSFRQGWDDAQHFGKPNRKLYEDPDYADGFDGYMKEHPIIEELKKDGKMTEQKHTPGQWVINYNGRIYAEPTKDDKYNQCICKFLWSSFKEFNEGNNAANARLIAESPTMYSYIEERANAGDMKAREIISKINA